MAMKRLQIMIEEELDDALGREARKAGVSKASLIRSYVRSQLEPARSIEDDPIWDLVGAVDVDPVDDIDEVIYGGKTRNRP